jgi:phosphate-selective porin OprO/OprP
MKNGLVLGLLSIVLLSYSSHGQLNTTFGKGIINAVSEDSTWSMKFGLRFQSLYSGETTINDNTGVGSSTNEFLIRRSRLKFDGFAFSPKLKYKLEIGLSNRDIGKASDRTNVAPNMILDAVLKWNFYQNFELWAGQTKLPGNRERVISSANMQMVDRSQLNSNFNIDRDIGLQLRHKFQIGNQFVVKEIVAMSQGEGRNVVQDNIGGLQYTGRLELLPLGDFSSKGDYFGSDLKREAKPKLAIGATYDYNDRAVKDRSNQGSYMTYDTDKDGNFDGYFYSNIATVFVDMMFKYKGVSIMGEYADRSSDQTVQTIVNDDLSTTTATVFTGNSLNLQAGYLFKSNWEVSGRYTEVNPTKVTGKSAFQQYTFGVSKYIVGHSLKVQSDVSYTTTDNSTNNKLMYRLQFDIHF